MPDKPVVEGNDSDKPHYEDNNGSKTVVEEESSQLQVVGKENKSNKKEPVIEIGQLRVIKIIWKEKQKINAITS